MFLDNNGFRLTGSVVLTPRAELEILRHLETTVQTGSIACLLQFERFIEEKDGVIVLEQLNGLKFVTYRAEDVPNTAIFLIDNYQFAFAINWGNPQDQIRIDFLKGEFLIAS